MEDDRACNEITGGGTFSLAMVSLGPVITMPGVGARAIAAVVTGTTLPVVIFGVELLGCASIDIP